MPDTLSNNLPVSTAEEEAEFVETLRRDPGQAVVFTIVQKDLSRGNEANEVVAVCSTREIAKSVLAEYEQNLIDEPAEGVSYDYDEHILITNRED